MISFEEDDSFTGPPIDGDAVARAQDALGYRLPDSYVALIHEKNGGKPRRRQFRTGFVNSWADDHIEILAFKGIGGQWGIDSSSGRGSCDAIAKWGYPEMGVVVCEMPSGGHDTVMLDYSRCGPDGEPAITYVNEDRIPRRIADTFAHFFEGLC